MSLPKSKVAATFSMTTALACLLTKFNNERTFQELRYVNNFDRAYRSNIENMGVAYGRGMDMHNVHDTSARKLNDSLIILVVDK